nr:hypothetical protein [Donghicola mangrovi]
MAFEDLETAVDEVEAQQDASIPAGAPARKPARRNRGNLPAELPRFEQMIEP